MKEYIGWLFDLYAHPSRGIVLWLVGEDGKRYFFHQNFEITFYVAGPFPQLRELWRFLKAKPVKLARTQRDDLYAGVQDVLEVRVASPAIYPELFREVNECFPELTYYDADIPLVLRYNAAHNVFPLAYCRLLAEPDGTLVSITALDSPWTLNPKAPPLRELNIEPDVDPSHAPPQHLLIDYDCFHFRAPLDNPRELLLLLNNILRRYNPDIILTSFGDTWLFSYLEELSQRFGIPFTPHRDLGRSIVRRKEISFHNYGQAHYRGEQMHLLGRWHIDTKNCMTFSDYGLAGAIEQARVTGLPAQEVARRSPGAGIAAMQTLTALRRGVLVPYQHQKGEVPKTYNQLFKADRGGLVFAPLPGIFHKVAILDFVSMYPSIMIEYNLSPETVGVDDEDAWEIPELEIRVSSKPGLVPEALRPLRDKRVVMKRMLKSLDKRDALYLRYKALVSALKWTLVVAYGRLGFANAAFGRINSHEAVTHIGRQVMLRAKAIAEDHGYTVIHLYVDSLFICRPGVCRESDLQPVLDEIERETGLPIELEALYDWMAFVSSREKPSLTIANRFFGLQEDGEYKIRGLALRRGDTSAFVASTQMDILSILAREKDPSRLVDLLPDILAMLQGRLSNLKNQEVPLQDLLITQTLSRELDDYHVSSPLARAALQLQNTGKNIRMGQRVQFIYTIGEPGVFAWDLPETLDSKLINVHRYKVLFFRAAFEVLQPLGVSQDILKNSLLNQANSLAVPLRPIQADLSLFIADASALADFPQFG